MDLDGLLKSKEVWLESLDKTVTVYELSWGGQMEIQGAMENGDTRLAGALTVKHGLRLEQSADEIADQLSVSAVNEISDVVWSLLGLDDEEKNSESTLKDASGSS